MAISDELALSRIVLHATIFELLGADGARLQLSELSGLPALGGASGRPRAPRATRPSLARQLPELACSRPVRRVALRSLLRDPAIS